MFLIGWILGPITLYAFVYFVAWLGLKHAESELAKNENGKRRKT